MGEANRRRLGALLAARLQAEPSRAAQVANPKPTTDPP